MVWATELQQINKGIMAILEYLEVITEEVKEINKKLTDTNQR